MDMHPAGPVVVAVVVVVVADVLDAASSAEDWTADRR